MLFVTIVEIHTLILDVCVCLKETFVFQNSLQETLTKFIENTAYFAVDSSVESQGCCNQ